MRRRVQCPPEFAPGVVWAEAQLRRWLQACGQGVRVFLGCRIFPPDRVSVGDYSQIDEGVWIFAGEGVAIGAHVHLAHGASITGGGRCTILDFAGLGAGVRLLTGTEEIHEGLLTNPTIPARWRKVSRGQVVVGAHALVFTNSLVLPNVTIGEGAVVAAGSVVHHSLKPWGVFAGNPLVQVGVRDAAPVLEAARQLQQVERRHPSLRSSAARSARRRRNPVPRARPIRTAP